MASAIETAREALLPPKGVRCKAPNQSLSEQESVYWCESTVFIEWQKCQGERGFEPISDPWYMQYSRRGGRVAEGNGLLNRHSSNKGYRGFESLSLRIKQNTSVKPGYFVLLRGGVRTR